VGLGKTWIGKKLLEDYAYHQRQKALVVCRRRCAKMWSDELSAATIATIILSQEELGQGSFDPVPYSDSDVILVDESHNFRTGDAEIENLERRFISGHGGRGKQGKPQEDHPPHRHPINNDLFDLYNQITLFTGNDRSYFAVRNRRPYIASS